MDSAVVQVLNTAKADTLLIFEYGLHVVRSEKDEAVECAVEGAGGNKKESQLYRLNS